MGTLIRSSSVTASNEFSQQIFLLRNNKNYPRIITKYSKVFGILSDFLLVKICSVLSFVYLHLVEQSRPTFSLSVPFLNNVI